MQYSVTFRHMEPSETLKEYGRDKLGRLEKYLDAVIDAEVVMTVEKFRHRAEVLISSDGLKIKAEEETEDMYSALDMVVDKLEKQIKRHREKLKDHKGAVGQRGPAKAAGGGQDYGDEETEAGPDSPPIDKRSTVSPAALSVDQAAERLAAGQEPWLLFIDNANDHLSILRQLADGRLELMKINH